MLGSLGNHLDSRSRTSFVQTNAQFRFCTFSVPMPLSDAPDQHRGIITLVALAEVDLHLLQNPNTNLQSKFEGRGAAWLVCNLPASRFFVDFCGGAIGPHPAYFRAPGNRNAGLRGIAGPPHHLAVQGLIEDLQSIQNNGPCTHCLGIRSIISGTLEVQVQAQDWSESNNASQVQLTDTNVGPSLSIIRTLGFYARKYSWFGPSTPYLSTCTLCGTVLRHVLTHDCHDRYV